MALYRKYRPATFAEVVGQEHVTEPLSVALEAGRINHAYLFSGPRGCGKTSSARILARSLNCAQGPTATPCGVCESCEALAPNAPGSIDVVELDAASHGGVDDTRELRDRAFYAPAQSRYRVFIVDEAHMVTTAGFNALLKIVEEPPEHLIFIFATTEPEKVLPTIRSRTHHYPFRLLPPRTMRGLIGRICEQEGVVVDDAVYPLVIRAGGGSPRDTLSVLDQLVAGSDHGDDGIRVTYQRALGLLGATDVALIDDAVDALAAGDAAALFGAVESVIDAGHDPRRFATDLLERFRDLLVLQAVPDAVSRGVVDAPEDVLDRMRDQAARIGPATLTRYAEVVQAGLGEMRGATAPRLLLEVICARLLLPSASDAESALLQRVERIETRLAMSIPAAAETPDTAAPPRATPTRPADTAAPPRAPADTAAPRRPAPPEPAPESATAPTELNAAAVRSMWPTVRDKVRQRSRTTEVMLAGATVRALDGNTLVLTHDSAPLARRLSEQRNADVIAEALKDALGVAWRVRCEVGGPEPVAASVPAQAEEVVPETDSAQPGEDEEESMLAEASRNNPSEPRRDPEEAALELLRNELGARPID
ncbi:DNA polymerase III, subunit gamma and tau [Mycobacterium kansasii 732]|uniref:DNA polymerase III subunit gamma/tau n=2 Tax=Mycobacterium pseudokansasii TaxID=2341080 RepID=A0A498R2R2_9MYCO|nr:DNA polymerase III subunits gamma/tau [Mycobacterium pseudokansasii]EUA06227.1 DNA polymerase III, subunit gamma and tau [Mycobacterium kansasii 732]KZS70310.1 DNA polymerase III subunit gamma/tau [Mycobacterium kansasii]VBA33667.1 DNA polymerase III subunit gamma/tau [Mycobacterium pseudokansasii]VBA35218.1 DNA polymerase III subunit gamma/tau [Mycobacterium pseudokansasii]VBA56331.1 DNA polymerase III subunit gamma/tau [Mycobacterium pseudokansasii]